MTKQKDVSMVRVVNLLVFTLVFGAIAAGGFVDGRAARAAEPLRTAADRPVDVLHLRLDLDVSLKLQRIAGTATLDVRPLRAVRSMSLDAVGHDVASVTAKPLDDDIAPAEITFDNTGKTIDIEFSRDLQPGETWRLAIQYAVRNPPAGLYFFRPTKQEPQVPWMVWSQGEPEDNRYWFPCFDHPNERQTTELIGTIDAPFELLSNGKRASKTTIDGGKRTRFHWVQDRPHVAYLVTLVAGDFAVTETSWRGKPVLFYVPRGREADTERTFGRTVAMLEFFSNRFGVEYPWDKYAQVVVEQFIIGGMENTSATTLYEGTLHDERAMLDSTPDWLIAHELGHQWWGDLLTCKDWAHLWLNEGFATYCEVLWNEHALGADERDYALWQKSASARSGTPLKRPVTDRHYANPSSMFDNRAYPKAGWILHMLRRQLGDSVFFPGLQKYANTFAYQTVETSDFRQTLERMTGRSLERFFYDWTERPGHPVLDVRSTYQPKSRTVRIEVKQVQEGDAFHVPLAIDVELPDGGVVPLRQLLTEKTLTLSVPVAERPIGIRVDPEYSVLAEIRETKERKWWVRQITEAPTVPERLRAVQHFKKTRSADDIKLLGKVLNEDPFWAVRQAAAQTLGTTRQPAARDLLIAGLQQSHPKVRRGCIDALKAFKGDRAVIDALTQAWERDDPSYYVQSSLLSALAAVQTKVPAEPFVSALERDSHRDVIRTAALKALANNDDPRTLTVLRQRTGPENARDVRRAAVDALSLRHQRSDRDSAEARTSLKILLDLLPGAGPRLRQSVLAAIGRFGQAAESAVPKLEEIATTDASQRVRDAAEAALKQIREDAPLQQQIKTLQQEVRSLEKNAEELKRQLQQLKSTAP